MKEKLLLIVVMITTYCLNAQNDSIVQYLDSNHKFTTIKNEAKFLDIRKFKDTVWEVNRYYRDGKIYDKTYSLSPAFNKYVGKHLVFYRNGQLKSKYSYNLNHQENGKVINWFDNGKRSYTGFYKNGIKTKLWKYYHYNGQLASKFYYDEKGELSKFILFDNEGMEMSTKEYVEFSEPIYKEGKKEFSDVIDYFIDNSKSNYAINTTVNLSFIIDVDGSIRNVWVVNNISNKLKKEIEEFFESIKGWKPAMHMGRKIPFDYDLSISFNTVIMD